MCINNKQDSCTVTPQLIKAYRPKQNFRWDYVSTYFFEAARYHAAKALLQLNDEGQSDFEKNDGLYHEGACVESWIKAVVALESPALLFEKPEIGFVDLEKRSKKSELPDTALMKKSSELLDFFYRADTKSRGKKMAHDLLQLRNSAVHAGRTSRQGFLDGSLLTDWLRFTLKEAGFNDKSIKNFFNAVQISSKDRGILQKIWERYLQVNLDLLKKLAQHKQSIPKDGAEQHALRIYKAEQKDNKLEEIDSKTKKELIQLHDQHDSVAECNITDCPCCNGTECAINYVLIDVFESEEEVAFKLVNNSSIVYSEKFHCFRCCIDLNERELDALESFSDNEIQGLWERPSIEDDEDLEEDYGIGQPFAL